MKYRFIDRVVDCAAGKFLVATKLFSLEEYFLLRPLGAAMSIPPSLSGEALLQAANLLIYTSCGGRLGLFGGCDQLRWLAPLGPGAQLTITARLLALSDHEAVVSVWGHSDDQLVAELLGGQFALQAAATLVDPYHFEALLARLQAAGPVL